MPALLFLARDDRDTKPSVLSRSPCRATQQAFLPTTCHGTLDVLESVLLEFNFSLLAST